MDNNVELKRDIRKRLLSLSHAKPAGKSIILFCPFCLKDTDHGHFYVTIDENSDMPILYHCFRCEMAGVLNGEVMRTLGVSDLHLNSKLVHYNNSASRHYSKGVSTTVNQVNVTIPIGESIRDDWKKSYIEKRLGISFTYDELKELKCIFSLKDFLERNKIERITTDKETALNINSDYAGFLTMQNEFIIFRDCTNKHKLRYNKYDIFRSLDNTKKFYTIPNRIDVLSTANIHIVLAEGVFDILGVYYHVFQKRKKNMIYVAICGCGYETVMKYFIQLGLIGSNIHMHIFSDKDKNKEFYMKMINRSNIKDWIEDITLYYNSMNGEKDFGVPKERITLVQKKL